MQAMSNIIRWENISNFVESHIAVFTAPEVYLWAEKAWHCICDAGLATYSNEIEKQIVFIRALTIITIYGEFCDLVADESFERDTLAIETIHEEFVSEMRIWQLVGKDFYADSDISKEDHLELTGEALNELIDKYRDEVCTALVKGFGGQISLFISMLYTIYSHDDSSLYSKALYDSNWERFNVDPLNLEHNKERALYWINIGCCRSPKENV